MEKKTKAGAEEDARWRAQIAATKAAMQRAQEQEREAERERARDLAAAVAAADADRRAAARERNEARRETCRALGFWTGAFWQEGIHPGSSARFAQGQKRTKARRLRSGPALYFWCEATRRPGRSAGQPLP